MHLKYLSGSLLASAALAAPIRILVSEEVNADHVHEIPTVEQAAQEVRTLVHRESLANLVTVIQDGPDAGTPEAFVEYYADCDDDGSLTFLSLAISSSAKNIAAGSPASLSIRVGDHPLTDHVNPKYPGSIPPSTAGSPRVSLRGEFTSINATDPKVAAKLKHCFLRRHRDARFWLPGNEIHDSSWVKFKVDGVYFIGGFGDRAYIGEIPADLYQSATPVTGPPPHHNPPHHPPPHHRPSPPHHPPFDSPYDRPHHFPPSDGPEHDFPYHPPFGSPYDKPHHFPPSDAPEHDLPHHFPPSDAPEHDLPHHPSFDVPDVPSFDRPHHAPKHVPSGDKTYEQLSSFFAHLWSKINPFGRDFDNEQVPMLIQIEDPSFSSRHGPSSYSHLQIEKENSVKEVSEEEDDEENPHFGHGNKPHHRGGKSHHKDDKNKDDKNKDDKNKDDKNKDDKNKEKKHGKHHPGRKGRDHHKPRKHRSFSLCALKHLLKSLTHKNKHAIEKLEDLSKAEIHYLLNKKDHLKKKVHH